MKRRTMLTSVGALTIAGCTSFNKSSDQNIADSGNKTTHESDVMIFNKRKKTVEVDFSIQQSKSDSKVYSNTFKIDRDSSWSLKKKLSNKNYNFSIDVNNEGEENHTWKNSDGTGLGIIIHPQKVEFTEWADE